MNKRRSSGGRAVLRTVLAAVIAVGLGTLLVWGFIEGRGEATAEAKHEEAIKPSVKVSHNAAGLPVITLGPELQKAAGIRVMRPKAEPYQRQIQAYGSVLDLRQFTDLSNTIANAKAQLAIAEAKLAASRAAFERAEALYKNGQNFSAAQLQAAEATYRSDQASARAAQVQTRNAAASASQAWGPVLGASLDNGTALAADLIQHKSVLVQVTLPIGVAVATPPQMASIETTTGQRARIGFVSAATRTDPTIQGPSFFYTADATSGALPGMNVIAFLPVGRPVSGVAIPASAIVWLQGRAWVYLQTAANTFTRREIATREPRPDGGYVVPIRATDPRPEPDAPASDATGESRGFPTNEPLVISGAQALLSQEFSAQIEVGGD